MTEHEKKITSIKVNNLYGFLNHCIHLREHGSTIIYGPNGSGKTTFLKIINALFDKNFDDLFDFQFESIEIGYIDGLSLKIDKIETDEMSEFSNMASRAITGRDLPEFLRRRNGLSVKYVFSTGINNKFEKKITLFQGEISDFIKKSDSWISNAFNLEKYKYSSKDQEHEEIKKQKKNDFMKILSEYIDPYNFYFIDINRTINLNVLQSENKDSGDLFKVNSYAVELSNIIKYAVAKSEETTEKSNKSFPQRMIESFRSRHKQVIDEDEIRHQYKETQKKINRIIKMGLLFRENNISLPNEDVKLNESELTVLSIYLSDLNKKIELYADIVDKIEVFLEIVGKKIRNKTMHINMDNGFYFRSKFVNQDENLKLDLLSSGEQHQISLFFQLIFLAKNSTFFLIDEPEISLHVDWQREFLDGLQMISKIRKHRFLIATHSPQIINGKLDLCEAMDIGENDEQT